MIPHAWEVKCLGDESISVIRGNKTFNGFEKVAFIPMEFVSDSNTSVRYEIRRREDVKSFTYCERGDLLLAKITPSLENGKQGIVPENIPNGFALASTEVFPISCKGIEKLFLFYVLKSPKFRNKIIASMIGTTGRQRASKESVEKLLIPLPPLPEQEKIAEVLSTVDEAIEKTGAAIEKTVRLKKGLMQRLLTHGIGHKEFKETEIGRIPKEWQIVRIKDIGVVLTGQTPATSNRTYWDGNIPFITPADINETKYVFKTERHVTSEGAEQIRRILPKDTVLVVCIGSTIGKTGITYIDSVVNQQINAVICNDDIDPHYTYYAITFRANLLKSFSGIAAVPIINKSLFEAQKISLPSNKKEQQKISEILSTIDSRLELLRDKKDKFERVKRGLMNDLLTGKRRLKV